LPSFIAGFPTISKFSQNLDQKKVFELPEDPSAVNERYLEYYDSSEVSSQGYDRMHEDASEIHS
jgi:hypothetical protein